MKRVVFAIVTTITSLVMLLSFKTHNTSATATPPAAISTGTTGTTSSGTGGTASGATPGNGSTGSSTGSSTSGSTSSSGSSSAAAATYTGDAADTRYGPVAVQVTVKNGKVTGVSAVEYPTSDPRDAQINAYAIPQLNSEAVSAGSANIDMVSGATYTSQGYVTSLQSALDKAGI